MIAGATLYKPGSPIANLFPTWLPFPLVRCAARATG